MQLTLREIKNLRVPLLIWLAVTAVAAVAGPFGTLEAMGVTGRVLYWGGVVGGSILLNYGANRLSYDMGFWGRLVVWAGFVVLVSGLSHLLNILAFSAWGGFADWAYLTGIVGLVTVAVHLVVWGVGPRHESDSVEASKANLFQRRLPIELRAPLVRIEAQDHYLNVVTERGSTLILMRLGDAMSELVGLGLQVHRSHWIAVSKVTKHKRESGRDTLRMSDGADIPVSRSFRSAAQDAGLL